MNPKALHNRKPSSAALALAAGSYLLIAAPSALAASTVSFTGVAAGDASSTEITLWTRATDSTNPGAAVAVTLNLSTDPTFATGTSSHNLTTTDQVGGDNTLKSTMTGLEAGTRYYYRFTSAGGATSVTGTFKTAPAPTANHPVHFAFSGDVDGQIRPYALTSRIAEKGLDFFMFDGDTIYETASLGSPAVGSTGTLPAPSATGSTHAQLFADFSRKYREQFPAVNTGGQNGLTSFFAAQGNYTAFDNHELGNKQYINGGAPAGGPVGDFSTGAGVDARVSANDTVPADGSVPFMNQSGGFQTLRDVYMNYQPVMDRGTVSAPGDARMDGTKQLYFSQQWGRNSIFVNVDDRSYRDIRIKTASNADDTGARADNPNRTMLGAAQLAWLEQTLLAAEQAGTTWKFVNISDPIDQIGPISGALALLNSPTTAEYGTLGTVAALTTTASSTASKTVTVLSTVGLVPGQPVAGSGVPAGTTISAVNTDGVTFTVNNNCTLASSASLTLTPAASTYAPVSADGGKSWIGGYRAERNKLLKFIADNQIKNVVFLATDDHQNRVNELLYSPTGQLNTQSSYVKVPYCFAIVCGPLGATGPDQITNHNFALAEKLAGSIASAQTAVGVEPVGLGGYPGLHDVTRFGHPAADTVREAGDFYSPDSYNYNVLDVTPDGKTLKVTSYGINSTTTNSLLEYDATNNPEKVLFSFQVDAAEPLNNIDHIIVVYQENWSFDSLYGNFPGANGRANAGPVSLTQRDRLTGNPLSTLTGTSNYNNASKTSPLQNTPPQPLNGAGAIDANFPGGLNTLLPFNVASYVAPTSTTGDIVHRYWQEQLQINGGANDRFMTWSDNPGLVMSYYDATNLPEGLLAQQYTMCDNFFHSSFGGSFLNHQFLIADAAPVYPNAATLNAGALATLDSNGVLALNGSGKISHDGSITPVGGEAYALDGEQFDNNYVVNTSFSVNMCPSTSTFPSAGLIPSQNNTNPTAPNYIPNIGDRLDDKGVNWKWYSGGWNNALASSKSNPLNGGTAGSNTVDPLFQWHHQPFAFYERSKPFDASQPDGRNPYATAHLQDEANLYTDISGNTLPAVSFVKFLGPDNEHPGYASLQQGQQHVADLVAKVQANPALWAHTLILVTYDEHGGRWDHVAPPIRDIWGPGVRVPCILISPLAKKGFVDHVQRDTSSILSTIEQRFGLQPLNERDAVAPTFADALTTMQVTRSGFTYSRGAQRFVQTVTVTNNGSVPVAGPIQLVLDNLSAGVALANKTGTAANGSPYITVGSGSLAAGASMSVQLSFTAPPSGGINYNARTATGTVNP